jgi:hypothetical protein
MKVQADYQNQQGHNGSDAGHDPLPGYPLYPDNEDVYTKLKKESDIDPEDVSKVKEFIPVVVSKDMNELDFSDDVSGVDLDIPGAELDNDLEAVGSEDEENHYYSLGGDNHNDLEENKGD